MKTNENLQLFKISGPSVRIWTGLGACFGVQKVAKKAKVDSGPKRESHVLLLVPPLGTYMHLISEEFYFSSFPLSVIYDFFLRITIL